MNTNILSYIPTTDMVDVAIEDGMLNQNDLQNINDGKEGCRVDTGSERNSQKLRMYQDYLVLYKLIGVLPKWVIQGLLKRNWHRKLGWLEPYGGYIARLLVMDKVDQLYVLQHFHYMWYWFKRKIGLPFKLQPVSLPDDLPTSAVSPIAYETQEVEPVETVNLVPLTIKGRQTELELIEA